MMYKLHISSDCVALQSVSEYTSKQVCVDHCASDRHVSCSPRYVSRTRFPRYCRINTHTRLRPCVRDYPGKPVPQIPIWILLKQETVSGSGISWAICKPAPRSRQITTPAPYHSVFLQAGCPSCRPTNSVKALKVRTAGLPVYPRMGMGMLTLFNAEVIAQS